MKEKIYNFFENPQGVFGIGFQVVIFIMIIISVGIAFVEFFEHGVALKYHKVLLDVNHVILAVFTVEYILKLATAPSKLKFIRRPMSVIDFLAIFPNYIELFLHVFVDTTELRVLRVIRLLRFARVLRVLRLFKYGSLFKKIFKFQETILEAILPVLIMFVAFKSIIWVLELYGLWITNADLGNLFAIIGFALGIILSQKIGVSYDKFLQVEEASIRIYSNLKSLELLLDSYKKGIGYTTTRSWAKTFLSLLLDPKANNFAIKDEDDKLFKVVSKTNKESEPLITLYTSITQDGAFCLSKKVRLTPKAYDTLLHQATMLYLALVAVFIPGITGMVSVITATYILYGMYNLTQDLDSILGGEFNLINIDMSELKNLVERK